ncbi:hypothetical protein VTP01DRAFT_1466 [Rhizomucor pusillus]|uniref:uncharacterized protein n=1 Tax=Rhizomucor pusillus TaxID=4840 RepID=UPI0037441309
MLYDTIDLAFSATTLAFSGIATIITIVQVARTYSTGAARSAAFTLATIVPSLLWVIAIDVFRTLHRPRQDPKEDEGELFPLETCIHCLIAFFAYWWASGIVIIILFTSSTPFLQALRIIQYYFAQHQNSTNSRAYLFFMVLIAIIGKIVALFIRWPANHILNFVFVSIMGMFALYAVEVYTPYYSTQKLLSNLRVYVVALGVMIVGNNITGLVPWFAAQIMDFVLNKLASALALIVAAATSHSWVLSQKGYHTATRNILAVVKFFLTVCAFISSWLLGGIHNTAKYDMPLKALVATEKARSMTRIVKHLGCKYILL